jgi:hypothetical protein
MKKTAFFWRLSAKNNSCPPASKPGYAPQNRLKIPKISP